MRELGPYSAILTGGKAQSMLSRVVNNVIVLMLISVILDNVNVNVVTEDEVNVDSVDVYDVNKNVDHGT